MKHKSQKFQDEFEVVAKVVILAKLFPSAVQKILGGDCLNGSNHREHCLQRRIGWSWMSLIDLMEKAGKRG